MLTSFFKPLCVVSLPYAGRQHYMHGFDLANPSVPKGFEDYLPEPFNVSTATDQELADEYRRLADIRYPVADELLQRGYKAFLPDGRTIKLHKEIVFSKTATETIKL